MAEEYFLMLYPDYPQFLWVESIWGNFEPLLPMIRLSTPLLYLLLCIQIKRNPVRQHQQVKTPSQKALAIGLLLFILSILLFAFLPLPIFSYPFAGLLMLIAGPLIANNLHTSHFGIKSALRKKETALGFSLRLNKGFVNITNPARGTLVIGAAGSGKSYSVAEPMLYQAAAKGYTGLLYDFKFPALTEAAYEAFSHHPKSSFYVVNFLDLSRSHRINPLKPENMPVMAYAEEFAQAILSNLMPETIQKKDFWIRSAQALLTACIWYVKKHHPKRCTLPHVIALLCSPEYEKLVLLLSRDPETGALVASLKVAIDKKADSQLAGVLASIQITLARIHSPEIAWVLSGDDIDLQLNDPRNPKFLCLGSCPSLSDSFAPVISLIITAALKRLNTPNMLPSLVLLDEAPTLWIPRFEMIPATARSNKVATVYMAQDLSQMVQQYGRVNAEVILANLNNQLFGRVANQRTAEYVSAIFGKEDKEVKSFSEDQTHGKRSVSYSLRETQLLKPQLMMQLRVGEFIGMTVEPNQPFQGKVVRKDFQRPKAWMSMPILNGCTGRRGRFWRGECDIIF